MRSQTSKRLLNAHMNIGDDGGDSKVATDAIRSVANEYSDGRTNIHLHVGFASEEYCAILDRNSQVLRPGDALPLPRNPRNPVKRASGEQQVSVLIRVAQDLQLPEMLPVIVWPRTVARLKRVYDGAYCIGYPFELVPLLSLIQESVFVDRELVPGGRGISFGQHELPDKVVKGTTEVVKHLTKKDFKAARHRRHLLEAADLLSRLVIDIAGDDIGIEVTKGEQLSAQRLDVYTGPVILGKRTFEGSHDTNSPEDSKDAQGPRNTRADAQGCVQRPRKVRTANQALNSPPPHEEERGQITRARPSGGNTAKHTRSGSLEDA